MEREGERAVGGVSGDGKESPRQVSAQSESRNL